jgi:hypothetical protein
MKEEQRKSEMRREIARKDKENKENLSKYKDMREQNQSKERFSKERTRPSQKPLMDDQKPKSFYLTEKEAMKVDRSYFDKTTQDRRVDTFYGKLNSSLNYGKKK